MNKLKYDEVRNSVTLCCNSVKCPVVEPCDDDMIKITDDFGKTVTMTKEQANMIPEALTIIEKKK